MLVKDRAGGRHETVRSPGLTKMVRRRIQRAATYDGNGNVSSEIDRDGRERTFDYDLVGDRVDEVWWSGSTVVEEINYFYYQAGQLNEAYDDSSYVEYSYDLLGRVTQEYESNDGSLAVDLDYTYDAAGNITSVSDGTDEVDYTYTPTNQLATAGLSLIGGSLGANVSLSYDSDERLSGETRREGTSGDTVSTSYIYDYASELTEINNTSSAAGALSSFNYGHDDGGRVTTYSGPEGSRAYTYDNTNQLTSVTDTGTSTVLESFTYDANGNRETANGVSYTTGTNNELTSDGTYTYTYDNEGNTLTKSGDGQYWEYTYDYRNRLTEAKELTGVGGSLVYDETYTYDVFDRRIGVDDNGTETWTAYQGQNAWADYNSSGTLTTRYLNGLGMDQRFARLSSGTVGWYITDNINSVRQIVGTSGSVVYSASYTAFGTIATQSGSGGDRFKFTGREYDAGTGQYYYRARYYGAGVGRFTSQDPKNFQAGEANLYRYVANNTIIGTDPSGQKWSWSRAFAGALVAFCIVGAAGLVIASGGAATPLLVGTVYGVVGTTTVAGGIYAGNSDTPGQAAKRGAVVGAGGALILLSLGRVTAAPVLTRTTRWRGPWQRPDGLDPNYPPPGSRLPLD